ncbi:MAG: pyrroline-5-carboxylate reductase [Bifidobacteriaceae bacterium]|nr:pyrroline-5-carboxylate reductase [Bifidobacteriaceae bacterium]
MASINPSVTIAPSGPSVPTVSIGFIGFGAMAQGIATGMVRHGGIDGAQIMAYDINADMLASATAALGATAAQNASEVVDNSEFVILAVKPNVIESVVEPIKGKLADEGTTVISIAWGWDYARYEQILAEGTHHLSIVPNTPIAVGKGVVVAERKNNLTPDEIAEFTKLFSPISLVEFLDTATLYQAGTVTSCAPAYAAMFIEALSDAAVKHGIPRAAAYRLVSAMVEGTGALQVATGQIPAAMKDAVCSPGGATIRGVQRLEERGFRGDVMSAVDAVMGD